MNGVVRAFVAVVLAALFEWLFFQGVKLVLKPPKREVNRVIQISLIKPKVKSEKISVERVKGQKKKSKPVEKKVVEKPKVEVKKPKKELPKPKKFEKEKRVAPQKKEPQGLKPMQGNLPASYLEAVREAISQQIFYPLEAIEKGIEGPVMVQFVLNRQGKVLECKALYGEPILTEATCLAIKKASFPPIPKSVKNDKLTFRLSLEYNLKKAFGEQGTGR
jgi:protein TonB